jgi:ribonuclease D
MVHHFLGVQLEKSERIGNWGLRPLRLEREPISHSQIAVLYQLGILELKYAAQDAHCLVQLYQKISPLILS